MRKLKKPDNRFAPAERRARFRAYIRSLVGIDPTQIALVPGMRTAIILMVEWTIFGIANEYSTAFQLGCLYVGFTDPNGSLGKRLHYMGTTASSVIIVGALLPSMVWRSRLLNFLVAVLLGFVTGFAPIFGSQALSLALKLGTALFSIKTALNRNNNGYGGPGVSIFWTFLGASASLLAALLPELIGNRDAIRTDLYKVWHGFGMNLEKWSAQWNTLQHYSNAPAPTVTMSMSKTRTFILRDDTEDAYAKEWLLNIMDIADTIRTASLCLSNGYEIAQRYPNRNVDSSSSEESKTTIPATLKGAGKQEIDELLLALACACKWIANAFHFPWTVRYVPLLKSQLQHSVDSVKVKAENCKKFNSVGNTKWLPALVDLLQTQIESIAQVVLNVDAWPSFSSISSIPKRICSAVPLKLKKPQKDVYRMMRSHAIRFAIAFSLATIPELFIQTPTSAHWFPMTVVLIMSSEEGTTYEKVAHRTLGTLLGIGLGSALVPLFQFPQVLILLLGLNTYAVCVFFQANYAIFTFFITAWVFCTTVGGGAHVGMTIFYRCLWTLSAAALVLLVTFVYPTKTVYNVSEKLANVARAIKVYAQSVLQEHCLRTQQHVEQTDVDEVRLNVTKARQDVIQARVAMLRCIHDAVLIPTSGELIDAHVVGPAIASDLVDAIVVPQFVSLVQDQSADGLLADFDDETFAEIDRLVNRLEYQAYLSSSSQRGTTTTNHIESNDEIEQEAEAMREVRGPFSYAIASAHEKLDEIGVPIDAKASNCIANDSD